MSIESGKYSIAGLGMVIGLPAEELERRRQELGDEAMADAVAAPLSGIGILDLEAEAVRRAIRDAGLSAGEVNGAVKVTSGPRDPAGFYEMSGEFYDTFPRLLGLPVNFYYRVGRGGSATMFGIATALGFLELGLADYVAVAGSLDAWSSNHSAHRGAPPDRGDGPSVSPRIGMWGAPFGRTAAAHDHVNLASRHAHEYGTKPEHFGEAAIQIREWACRNPLARMYGRPATLEDYFNSPVYVHPYHFMDMSLSSDGAVGFIVTSTERARALRKTPVEILGLGSGDAQGGQWFEGPAHYTKLAVANAKEKAFGQAGVTISDIDVAELYDCFTGEVVLQVEDYGWCAKGEGGPFIAEQRIGPGGRIPINTSGGLLSAYHLNDLTCVSEAVIQLRHEGGARQVDGAELALASGHGGEVMAPGLCSIHTTMVLGRSR